MTGKLAPFSDREHAVTPRPGSAVKAKTGFGTAAADLLNPGDYPVEAVDAECGEVVRSESITAGWTHTGRRPGDPR